MYYNTGGYFWGSAMDFVMFAKQTFLETCESLVVACELNNDIKA
jgi:hypothetical protein